MQVIKVKLFQFGTRRVVTHEYQPNATALPKALGGEQSTVGEDGVEDLYCCANAKHPAMAELLVIALDR